MTVMLVLLRFGVLKSPILLRTLTKLLNEAKALKNITNENCLKVVKMLKLISKTRKQI